MNALAEEARLTLEAATAIVERRIAEHQALERAVRDSPEYRFFPTLDVSLALAASERQTFEMVCAYAELAGKCEALIAEVRNGE